MANWSLKIKTAVSGINGELAEMLDAAEADGVRNVEEILKEDALADADSQGEPSVVRHVGEVHGSW